LHYEFLETKPHFIIARFIVTKIHCWMMQIDIFSKTATFKELLITFLGVESHYMWYIKIPELHFHLICGAQNIVSISIGVYFLMQNCEIRTLGDSGLTFITAQARKSNKEDNGFSFVHCELTGTGTGAYLGRAWFGYSTVIFSYCNMDNIFNKAGWSNNNHKEYDK